MLESRSTSGQADTLVTHRPAPGGRWRGFESCTRLFDDVLVEVEGELPAWLRGSLLLNGPALWDLPSGTCRHWFDGLAMLHRIRIADGGARYRNRWVDSDARRESLLAGNFAYGEFGSRDPSSWLARMRRGGAPRLTDNPAVVISRIGERWVAQTETPRMSWFDPDTLDTLGAVVHDDDERMDVISAHGLTDALGDYWNVGVRFGPSCTYLAYRIRSGGTRREVFARVVAKPSGYLHAFAVSRHHLLIWENAWRANMLSFLFTGRSYAENFRWQPEGGSRIHAIDLADGRVRSWDAPPVFAFHAIQASGQGSDLLLDLCNYPDASIVGAFSLERMRAAMPLGVSAANRRYILSPGLREARVEVLPGAMDLPQVDPRLAGGQAAYAWGAGFAPAEVAGFFDHTLRVDLHRGTVREWRRGGAVQLEPLYVPRPGATEQDDGVLLVPTLADHDLGTQVGVVDARRMEACAMLHLPQVVPFGFHAAWRPAPPSTLH